MVALITLCPFCFEEMVFLVFLRNRWGLHPYDGFFLLPEELLGIAVVYVPF